MARAIRISVIMPAFNAAAWVSDAIQSCLRQRSGLFELIVIDDGSTDDTYLEVSRHLQSGTDVLRVVRTENRGAPAARNAGLEAARGTHVLFVDADDMLTDGALETFARIAEESKADAVVAAHINLDEASGAQELVLKRRHYSDSYANAVDALWVQGAVLMRNSTLRWNENRTVWEGMEYILDFLAPQRTVAYTDFPSAQVRQHQSPTRISCRYDHFEPGLTGAFFSEQKSKLMADGKLTFERASALDRRILGNAYELLKKGHGKEADTLLAKVSWGQVTKYNWCKVGSLAWVSSYIGKKMGSRCFHYLNRAVGRV
jgi:glycosyltransferase involved in cell wall biosynthesis